jgi:hypothetical protein
LSIPARPQAHGHAEEVEMEIALAEPLSAMPSNQQNAILVKLL